MFRTLNLLGVLAILSGCVTGPLLGDNIEDPRAPIPFSVWTLAQGDVSVVHCRPFLNNSNPFIEIGRITSGSFSVTNDGDTVYRGLGSFVVPEYCWQSYGETFAAELKVTTSNGSYSYYTYDSFGLECLIDKFIAGISPFDAGADCQPSHNQRQIILLHTGEFEPGDCAPDGICPLP